jgi:acid phosphatase
MPNANSVAMSNPSGSPLAPGSIKHVFIVLEENTNYSDIIGNTQDMPFLNQLADQYAYAKNYYADTHPSIGNYFMLTTGQIVTNSDGSSGTVSEDNIVRQLLAAGKTWKEYSENIPSVGYTGPDKGGYTEHHNPLSYFSDVRNNSDQAKNLVPFSQLAIDIANNQLPDYAFIVPNEFNDAHSCPSSGSCNKLTVADNWLKTNLDPLLQSPNFDTPGGGLLIITFDESAKSDPTHGGGHTAWVAIGPDVKKGYVSDTFYQHANTLRFMAEEIGLRNFPGKAASAASMKEFIIGN